MKAYLILVHIYERYESLPNKPFIIHVKDHLGLNEAFHKLIEKPEFTELGIDTPFDDDDELTEDDIRNWLEGIDIGGFDYFEVWEIVGDNLREIFAL